MSLAVSGNQAKPESCAICAGERWLQDSLFVRYNAAPAPEKYREWRDLLNKAVGLGSFTL